MISAPPAIRPRTALCLVVASVATILCTSDARAVSATQRYALPLQTQLYSAVFSPDGQIVYTTGEGRTVIAWDAATGDFIRALRADDCPGFPLTIYALALNPDGSRIAAVANDGNVRVWDTGTGGRVLTFRPERIGSYLTYAAAGSLLVTVSRADRSPAIRVFDAETGALVRAFADEVSSWSPSGRACAITPEGRLAATTMNDNIAVWDITTGERVCTMDASGIGEGYDVQFSPDGAYVASAHAVHLPESVSRHGAVYLWNPVTGDSIGSFYNEYLTAGSASIVSLAISPDCARIYGTTEQDVVEAYLVVPDSAGAGGVIDYEAVAHVPAPVVKIWDVATGDSVGMIGPLSDSFYYSNGPAALSVSPDGQRAVTVGRSKGDALSMWDLSTGEHLHDLDMHVSYDYTDAVITPDGVLLGTPGTGGTSLVDIATGEPVTERSWSGSNPSFSRDGQYVVSSRADGPAIEIYNPDRLQLPSGAARVVLSEFATGDSARVFAVDQENATAPFHWLTDDGYVVAIGARQDSLDATSYRATAWRWNAETGALASTTYIYSSQAEHTTMGTVRDAVLLPDGEHAIVTDAISYEMWNVATGRRVYSRALTGGTIQDFDLSEDGQRLLILHQPGDWSRAVVCDAATGDTIRTIRSSRIMRIGSVAISADGESVVLGPSDATDVEIYSANSGELVASFAVSEPVGSAPFRNWRVYATMVTPDGARILAFLRDELQVWDIDPPLVGDLTAVEQTARPSRLSLSQNRPNPFNPLTAIRFSLPKAGHATISVYSVNGQRVRRLTDGYLSAGAHEVIWNGCDDGGRSLGSGVYLYRLTWAAAGAQDSRANPSQTTREPAAQSIVRRMILIR